MTATAAKPRKKKGKDIEEPKITEAPPAKEKVRVVFVFSYTAIAVRYHCKYLRYCRVRRKKFCFQRNPPAAVKQRKTKMMIVIVMKMMMMTTNQPLMRIAQLTKKRPLIILFSGLKIC